MSSFYLNTYAPLVTTKAGRHAAIKYSLPPFVDGSIRREPDFEHEYPAITCLGRGRSRPLASRLKEGDLVAYMLKKRCYGMGYKHQRLAALLRVILVHETHAEGAAWYRQQRLRLPKNCMVPRNHAFPMAKSHQKLPKHIKNRAAASFDQWEADNSQRANRWGTFVVCKRLFINLDWDAPEVSDDMLITAFGKVPSTQNPKRQTLKAGRRLLKQLGLR